MHYRHFEYFTDLAAGLTAVGSIN